MEKFFRPKTIEKNADFFPAQVGNGDFMTEQTLADRSGVSAENVRLGKGGWNYADGSSKFKTHFGYSGNQCRCSRTDKLFSNQRKARRAV